MTIRIPRPDPVRGPTDDEIALVKDVVFLWQMAVDRSVHQDRKGRWHGRAFLGYQLPGSKHIYDPAFLKFLRRWQDEDIRELADPDHRAWRKAAKKWR